MAVCYHRRSIASSNGRLRGLLSEEAGFPLCKRLLAYPPTDSYNWTKWPLQGTAHFSTSAVALASPRLVKVFSQAILRRDLSCYETSAFCILASVAVLLICSDAASAGWSRAEGPDMGTMQPPAAVASCCGCGGKAAVATGATAAMPAGSCAACAWYGCDRGGRGRLEWGWDTSGSGWDGYKSGRPWRASVGTGRAARRGRGRHRRGRQQPGRRWRASIGGSACGRAWGRLAASAEDVERSHALCLPCPSGGSLIKAPSRRLSGRRLGPFRNSSEEGSHTWNSKRPWRSLKFSR